MIILLIISFILYLQKLQMSSLENSLDFDEDTEESI